MRKPKLPPNATPPKGIAPKPSKPNLDDLLKASDAGDVALTPIPPNPHLKGK